LYECLSGKPPFRGSNILDTLTKHINDDPAEISNVPVALQLIVKRAMQKEPADRYQSMAEFRHDLETYLDSSETKFVPTLQMLLKLKGNRKRLVSAAVALLILGGGAAWAIPAFGPSPRFQQVTDVSWAWGQDPNPDGHKGATSTSEGQGGASNSSSTSNGSASSSSKADGQTGDGQNSSDGQPGSGEGQSTSDNQSSSATDGQSTADGQTSSSDGQSVADNSSDGQHSYNSDDNNKLAMAPSDDEDTATDMKGLGRKRGGSGLAVRGLTSETSDMTRANLANRMDHASENFLQRNFPAARGGFQWCVDNWEKCQVSKSDWDYARALSRLADCDRLTGKISDAETVYVEAYRRWSDIAKTEKDKTAGQDAKTLQAANRNAAITALYIAYIDSALKKQLPPYAASAWDSLRDAFADSRYLGVVRQDWSNVQWNLGKVVDAEVSRMMSLIDKVDPGKKGLDGLPIQISKS
jgi:hypothetical protein